MVISFSSHTSLQKPCQTKVENWLIYSYICSFGALTAHHSYIMITLKGFTETKDIQNLFTVLFMIPEEFHLILFCGEYHTWLPSLNVHVQYSFDSSLLIVILSFSKDEGPGIQCMIRANSAYHSSFLSSAITGLGNHSQRWIS